jgi:hypothetical protein
MKFVIILLAAFSHAHDALKGATVRNAAMNVVRRALSSKDVITAASVRELMTNLDKCRAEGRPLIAAVEDDDESVGWHYGTAAESLARLYVCCAMRSTRIMSRPRLPFGH